MPETEAAVAAAAEVLPATPVEAAEEVPEDLAAARATAADPKEAAAVVGPGAGTPAAVAAVPAEVIPLALSHSPRTMQTSVLRN